jgi:hypothetical protein
MSIFEAYSISSGAVASGDVITVNMNGASHRYTAEMFGFSGIITSAPYDTGAGLPFTGSGGNTVPTVSSIATTIPSDIVIAIEGQTGSTAQGVGSIGGSAATIAEQFAANTLEVNAEFRTVTSTLSGASASFSTAPGSGNNWIMLVDAIDPPAAGQGSGTGQSLAAQAGGMILTIGLFAVNLPRSLNRRDFI